MWLSSAVYAEMKAEIAVLTERVTALRALVTAADKYVADLLGWVAEERQRAEAAVDRMLNVKNLPGITPPKGMSLDEMSSMFEETPEAVAAIRKASEDVGIEEVLLGEN